MRVVVPAGVLVLAMAAAVPGKAQAPAQPSVVIDAGAPRAMMSKYIYGQFIEHPGRCVYGGIWAEMIDDRKFFHPVAEGESPWTILGTPRSVSMTTSNAFAGEHSPELELDGSSGPGGISQAGLGVVAGARYTGRVLLAGNSEAGPVEVSLVWGPGSSGRQSVTIRTFDQRYRPYPLAFTAGASSDDARLEIAARGKGRIRIGTVSLMPARNVEGFRPDVLALLKELNAPVYRWPGGNFVSGYDWRDGIGDRDRRPPRKNPAWKGVDHNDVGIHEFMAFCRLIGAEPSIAVNSGLASAASAADEVEYVNGAATTPMGAQRALNGQQAPFKVRWWSVGNEMYGESQLGHVPLAEHVKKHAELAAAMRAKDPSIELDQWNYPYAPHVCSEPGTRYFLKDAVDIAAGIHEYSRRSDMIFTANDAQKVNVIGAIKTTKTAAAFDTTGLVLKLYRAHFGLLPVIIAGAPGPLDVAAAWREDRSALTLAIVNPAAEPQALALQVKGAAFAPAATLRRIAGIDPLAYNEPGRPPAVKIDETANVPVGDRLTVPPMSISIYEVRAK